MNDLPKPRTFEDAINRIGTEGDGFDLTVHAEQDSATVTAQGQKGLGRGWSVGGAVSYTKEAASAAWAVWAGLSWRPKPKPLPFHPLMLKLPTAVVFDEGWPPDGTPYRPRLRARLPRTAGPPTIHQALQAVYRAGRRFELIADFEYESAIKGVGRFIAPKGMITDFHSVPRPLFAIFPHDDWAESAVAHDWLYHKGAGQHGPITRKQADQVHREVLLFLGASRGRADAMYLGLRIGSSASWNRYRGRG